MGEVGDMKIGTQKHMNIGIAGENDHWDRRRIRTLGQAEDMNIVTGGGYEHWDRRRMI